MTSPKRTTVAKTVTPPPDAVTTLPAPEADPFIPEFSGPSMTEDERSELDDLRAWRSQVEAAKEQQDYHNKLAEKVEDSTRHVDYEETAGTPCPIHYPLGWDGVDEAHDSVGCEHGHFPRARQADRAQRIAELAKRSGMDDGRTVFAIQGDPWEFGQDI